MNDMKISFKVEVTACEMGPGCRCPFVGVYMYFDNLEYHCGKADEGSAYLVYDENKNGLTSSCPMARE